MAVKNIFKKIILLIIGIAILLILIILYFAFNARGQSGTYAIVTAGENKAVVNNYNSQNIQTGPGLPMRLIIPSINVNAKIIYMGLDSKGAVGVPSGPYDVSWFNLGPRPGAKGSAIISGHYGPWLSGAVSVFNNLHKLKNGDKIYVKDDKGSVITFAVKEIRTYNPNDSPSEVFNKNDGIYLNLITCAGDWIQSQKAYNKRLVIFTQAI